MWFVYLVQQTRSTFLHQVRISHMVEPSHLHLEREDSIEPGCSGLTRPAYVILYSRRDDSHCVSCAPSGWRDVASAVSSVEQGKRDKHASTCRYHGFDFIPFGFSTLGSFSPEAEAPLSCLLAFQLASSGPEVGNSWLGILSSIFCRYAWCFRVAHLPAIRWLYLVIPYLLIDVVCPLTWARCVGLVIVIARR